jgi:MarR family transcriptional repressor of emrRAB
VNNRPTSRFDLLVASLGRLQARLPSTPVQKVMLSRILLELGRGIGARLEQHVRPFGLAEPEFRVLSALFSQPEGVAHPSDLCARTAQSPANMSRIADTLVIRDLITRVPSAKDRRRMVLRITEQGEEIVRRLLPVLFTALEAMLVDFKDEELEQLIALLKRLFERLDQPAPEDPAF